LRSTFSTVFPCKRLLLFSYSSSITLGFRLKLKSCLPAQPRQPLRSRNRPHHCLQLNKHLHLSAVWFF